MNLMKLKNVQLDELGRLAGVDVTEMSRQDKMKELKDAFTDEQFEQASTFEPAEEESAVEEETATEAAEDTAPVEEAEEEYVLIKMERRNPRYETHGKVFTKEHPYAAVPESVAKNIMDTERGFRPALPSEVREYYAK